MYLWKYVAPTRTIILASRTLRFSPAIDFNDPFEVVPYVAEFLPAQSEDQYLAQFDTEIPALYDESLRDSLAEYELTLEDASSLLESVGLPRDAKAMLTPPDLVSTVQGLLKQTSRSAIEAITPTFGREFQQKFGQRFGILCLADNPTSLLMWAHYADYHRGFVIGFHQNHPFFNRAAAAGAVGRALPVQYSDERPAIVAYDPAIPTEQHADRLIRQLLLTKSKEWQYEREYRLILPLDDQRQYPHVVTDEGSHLFTYPNDAVAAVIVGARASDTTKQELINNIISAGMTTVPVFQARTSDTKFAIIIEPST